MALAHFSPHFNIFNLLFKVKLTNFSMTRAVLYIFFLSITFLLFINPLFAQDIPNKTDTFFLAKKKGWIGRFGESISITPPDESPKKVVNPFIKYKGKIIRSIETVRLGFEYDIDDTNHVKSNLGITVATLFHKNSTDKNIKRNLFFKEGEKLFPYLLADNERYLRELVFIKDARILVDYAEGSRDSVDVVILTKDVFSIGGNFSFSGTKKARIEIREENFLGSGTQIQASGYYEKQRFPQYGIGGELIRRNIGGSFIDWTSGYKDFKYAFSSARNQETVVYTRIEKPLVTPYIPSTGALEYAYQRTRNVYDADSNYRKYIKYAYYNIDAWFGYSLDSKRSLYANKEISIHDFVALRVFKRQFIEMPTKFKDTFDYQYTNSTGILASLNVFKQVFYKTSFIYGFGRTEDVPEGFSAVLTAGYVVKQNDGYVIKQNIKRPYSGLDISLANLKKRGLYFNYIFRIGGYFYQNRFEDVDLLFNVEHFTRLKKMSRTWYQRTFINAGITAQVNPVSNTPLFLNSDYGFRYFNNGTLNSDLRIALKTESVFYNTKKLLGFRFAPFVFGDIIMLKPTKLGLQKSDIYSAIGGGIRTRNENLVLGTIELKGYYFPRVNGEMKGWKIDLNSEIRFKYKSSFISRPNFIIAN